MQTDSDDSTYSAASSETEAESQEKSQSDTKYLTKQQLDEMWEQMQQLQDKQRRRDEYFQRSAAPKLVQEHISKITPELFNPACSRANLAKIGGKQVVEYAQQLQRYAPKIITIHETRRFWQMYKNQMDAGQLETLNQYVKSQQGFISRQRFLSDVKKRQK